MRFNIQINKGLDEDKIRISYPESDIMIISTTSRESRLKSKLTKRLRERLIFGLLGPYLAHVWHIIGAMFGPFLS